jgi:hypothetical protein
MIFKHLPVGSARFETLFLTMTVALTAIVENTVNDTHYMTLPTGASATKPTCVSIGSRVSDVREEMINNQREPYLCCWRGSFTNAHENELVFRASIKLWRSLTFGPTNTSNPPLSGEVKIHVVGWLLREWCHHLWSPKLYPCRKQDQFW